MNDEAARRELDSFKAAPLSLRRALAIAQKMRADSRIIDIGFDATADFAVYQVTASYGSLIQRYAINASNGSTVGTASETPISELGKQDQRMIVGLRAVREGLLDAIIVAERNTSGTAISAGITMDAGRLSFVVVCVSGDDLKEVTLEPPKITGHERRGSAAR
ncbi:MAG: peptidase [Bradyrhizobium sp.]